MTSHQRSFALAVVALVLAGSSQARAGLSLAITNSTASPGGTASFDVTLADTEGTFAVGGFSFELSVAGGSGVVFTGVSTSTGPSDPYLFGTLQAPPDSFTTFATTDFIASDADMTSPYTVTLNSGDLYGLGHVTYSVAPGAMVGPVTVSFLNTTGTDRTTEVDDISGSPFALAVSNGSIAVFSASAAVPEPASALLVGLGLAGLGLIARRSGAAFSGRFG